MTVSVLYWRCFFIFSCALFISEVYYHNNDIWLDHINKNVVSVQQLLVIAKLFILYRFFVIRWYFCNSVPTFFLLRLIWKNVNVFIDTLTDSFWDVTIPPKDSPIFLFMNGLYRSRPDACCYWWKYGEYGYDNQHHVNGLTKGFH